MDKYKDECMQGRRFSIPRYNNSLSICIPNLKVLCLAVTETNTETNVTQNLQKSVTEAGRTDGQHENSISPQTQFAGVQLKTRQMYKSNLCAGTIFLTAEKGRCLYSYQKPFEKTEAKK